MWSFAVFKLSLRLICSFFQVTKKGGFGGEAGNRWFDKPLQMIYFKNGTISCSGDVSQELNFELVEKNIRSDKIFVVCNCKGWI